MVMTLAVRALSVFLTVWLTAAASFPPCCWAMANAHDHRAPQEAAASPVRSHDHHHHGTNVSTAPTAALAVSAVPAHDCDTEPAEAVATPRAPLSSVDLRAATEISAAGMAPHASASRVDLSVFAPPGALSDSAFLNPLRI